MRVSSTVGDGSFYCGDRFGDAEVDQFAGWLQRAQLIDGINVYGPTGPIRSYLTDDGARCAEDFDCEVRRYTNAADQPGSVAAGHVVHVHGGNVQVATGNESQQTMTVHQTSPPGVDPIDGIGELLTRFGLTAGREAELAELRDHARAEVVGEAPAAQGIRRFCDWAVDCVEQGGTAAVVVVVTLRCAGLLQDAETLARMLGR